MRNLIATLTVVGIAGPGSLIATPAILKTHCTECHNGNKAKGKFKLTDLGQRPAGDNLQRWLDALDLVTSEEMPPEDDRELSGSDRQKLVFWLKQQLATFEKEAKSPSRTKARRLNNREFENSIRDVLLIEDIGTHQPTANLLGDSLFQGFDTHGDTLGFSKFHLEQYIEAVRNIVDATILSGERPESQRYEISSDQMAERHFKQNTKRPERRGKANWFDFLDPKGLCYFGDFKTVPTTGRYLITVRATGKDRGVYPTDDTGMYHDDPIHLVALMGDREKIFELPDEKIVELEIDEWLSAGTRFRLQHRTDGLKMRGNGNFKFQNAITGFYLKENQPEVWKRVVANLRTKPGRRPQKPDTWHNWVNHWMGPRPRLFSAVVEGPYFESWPPKRQRKLIGRSPSVTKAEGILRPIAERAWRRPVREGELDRIVALVNTKAKTMNDIEALKEGIVAVLVSPAFLLHSLEDATPQERFASKLSYFLKSTIPNAYLRKSVAAGKLDTFAGVRNAVQKQFDKELADPFLREFPFGWMKLNDINFMAPDPDQYRFYHRKDVSDDMVDEVLAFFRHAVENNIPVSELVSADYSFVNADLARVYQLNDVPPDSKLRKYAFANGRRGGLLGMSAFLTVTADSLGTSPIHRAIYVMENFLGIHPTPPPPDVIIDEPDVRAAKTIHEVLEAHRSDPNCASCHQSIDPYGYAFENFDPTGGWRDAYIAPEPAPADTEAGQQAQKKRNRAPKPTLPIDASAEFRNGNSYENIIEYRKLLMTDANRDRFVRCFVTKLLTYANGEEPEKADFAEIDTIPAKSAQHDYRIVETIAAVIDSSLFREE
jgi:hypothetical protein